MLICRFCYVYVLGLMRSIYEESDVQLMHKDGGVALAVISLSTMMLHLNPY